MAWGAGMADHAAMLSGALLRWRSYQSALPPAVIAALVAQLHVGATVMERATALDTLSEIENTMSPNQRPGFAINAS